MFILHVYIVWIIKVFLRNWPAKAIHDQDSQSTSHISHNTVYRFMIIFNPHPVILLALLYGNFYFFSFVKKLWNELNQKHNFIAKASSLSWYTQMKSTTLSRNFETGVEFTCNLPMSAWNSVLIPAPLLRTLITVDIHSSTWRPFSACMKYTAFVSSDPADTWKTNLFITPEVCIRYDFPNHLYADTIVLI